MHYKNERDAMQQVLETNSGGVQYERENQVGMMDDAKMNERTLKSI